MKPKRGNPKRDLSELRARWKVLLDGGAFTQVGGQGRLVALYVLLRADWGSCEVSLSVRRAATVLGASTSTVRRGIGELVDVGVLELVRGGIGKKAVYVVSKRAPVRRAGVPDGGAPETGRGRAVCLGVARSAPPSGAERAPVRRALRPHRARNSVSFSVSPVTNSERASDEATPGAGSGPAPASLHDCSSDAAGQRPAAG